MTEPGLSAERVAGSYELLFDPLTRAAQRAVLEYAVVTREDRWPTPAMVVDFARLYDVPAASLGAFFGLLAYHDGAALVWVDAVRGPVSPARAVEGMSREQTIAFGFLKCAMD